MTAASSKKYSVDVRIVALAMLLGLFLAVGLGVAAGPPWLLIAVLSWVAYFAIGWVLDKVQAPLLRLHHEGREDWEKRQYQGWFEIDRTIPYLLWPVSLLYAALYIPLVLVVRAMFRRKDAMIAVVGATGNTGRAVVKELKQLGQDPVCIVRNAEKAREILGANAKIAVVELTDRAALEKALQGAESVFVVTGHNPQMVEQQNNVLDAAQKAGAKFLVRVGGGRMVAAADSESIVGRGHFAIEERLRQSGIKWVILRPGLFMQNVLTQVAAIKNDNKIVLPFARDLPVALTDVRDTGAVGARILLDPPQHAGKVYEFTGKLTNYGEFAEVFSQVLGRKITYVAATIEQAEQAMKARGMPDWLVARPVTIAKLGAKGAFSTENTQVIRDIAKRAPLTTKQFVEDHKALFN